MRASSLPGSCVRVRIQRHLNTTSFKIMTTDDSAPTAAEAAGPPAPADPPVIKAIPTAIIESHGSGESAVAAPATSPTVTSSGIHANRSSNNNNTRRSVGATESSKTHILSSKDRGQSDIEKIVLEIEERRKNRLMVTFAERKQFLEISFEVAKREGRRNDRFPKATLIRLRDEFQSRVSKKPNRIYDCLLDFLGCRDLDESMLRLFQAGLVYTEAVDEDEFYFRDFNFYCTRLVSRFAIMRHPQLVVALWLLFFFFGSAVLFCGIMKNENVCPSDTDFQFGGWMTAIYFAGVTMSTVGYGDVSLYEEDKPGVTFVGTVYMLVAIVVGFTIFSTAAEMTFGGLFGFDMYSWLDAKVDSNNHKPLHQQIRRLVLLRIGELAAYFVALNAIGVFIARAFVNRSPVPDEQWNWSTTIYWAVQTTTTIGYGDLVQPFLLRWVNIFFVTFGTAFVGSVFGSLAALSSDISDLRRYYAWKRRDVSRQMIKELQVNDDKLDQFEFVLGSLMLLNKVNSTDITQIMDKFRELAGDKGYIVDEDAEEAQEGPVDEGEGSAQQKEDQPITTEELNEIPGGRQNMLEVFMENPKNSRPDLWDLDN